MGERLRLVRSATIPPARDLQVARTEDVSWLRANGSPSRVNDTQWRVSRGRSVLRPYMPVTVAGPRRTRTGFRESPFACNDRASLSRFPAQRNSEADREDHGREPDDQRDHRLRREPSVGKGDRELGAGRERRCAVARKAAAAGVLPPEGVELPGGPDGGRVLEQQVHFLGGLIDRHGHAPHRGGEDVRIAQLLALAGWERTVHGDGVAAPGHYLGRDVPLPDPELDRERRGGPRPGREDRVRGQ